MVSVIINPVSGGVSPDRGRARATAAMRALARAGVRDCDVVLTERRGHARELAAAALGRGATLVIAWGGDGTVNEVGSALVGSATRLGIVPCGSGNGLARELRLPGRPDAAIAAAVTARGRAIDVGALGSRWFFSIAGIGFDACVASAFDRDGSGRRGLPTYARITARELWRYRCGDYRIDGVPATGALLVTFANSAQFGNGARIAPGARLDDGLLDMVVFEERSRVATVRALPALFTGGVARIAGVSIRQVTSAVVEADVPMAYHVDGEPVSGGMRLEARVHPGALLVAA